MRGTQILFENYTAGEDLVAEELVYFSGNRTVSKTDASDGDKMPCIGITVEAATTGNSVSVLMFGAFENMSSYVFTGEQVRLYVSATTPGEITETTPAGAGGIEQTIGLTTSTNGLVFRPAFTDDCEIDDIIYVGKHGSNENSGRNICQAVLTIGQAMTLASALSPSSSNPIAIRIVDSGTYVEDVTISDEWIDIEGTEARLEGNLTVLDNCFVQLNEIISDTGTAVLKSTGDESSIVRIGKLISTSTGSGVLNTSDGILNVLIRFLQKTNGISVGTSSGTIGITHIDVQDHDLVDAIAVYHPGGGSFINYRGATIHDLGGTTSGFIVGGTGIVNAVVPEVTVDTLYNVASGGTLNLLAALAQGTRTSAERQNITVAGERWPIYNIYADQMRTVRSSNWAVNNVAPLAADSNNSALLVRLMDDTTEEGVGYEIGIPPQATYMSITFRGRAETTPAGTVGVAMNFYEREIPDNAAVTAWSGQFSINIIQLPTNENFQYDSYRDTLANFGLTAGGRFQIEITRDTDVAYDTLIGDYALYNIEIEFD